MQSRRGAAGASPKCSSGGKARARETRPINLPHGATPSGDPLRDADNIPQTIGRTKEESELTMCTTWTATMSRLRARHGKRGSAGG
jgi:hypothetical protein